ncbi:hypothetical protein [Bacillus sp. REN3]|uniref:hypothetical protein n=1 Tax=Bacillus sp. REN3 TaxID=2802440 RepID=UPI001AEEE7BB|nr:hypothetical protein [Bacillus sp. REN3]
MRYGIFYTIAVLDEGSKRFIKQRDKQSRWLYIEEDWKLLLSVCDNTFPYSATTTLLGG